MKKGRKSKPPEDAVRQAHVAYLVFVSHATADKWIAKALCEVIEATGAATFRDDRDIGGGDEIPEKIRREINRSNEMVVLITPESVDRPWVLVEMGAAWGRRKSARIIPVLCHVAADRMPSMISAKKAVQINAFDEYLDELPARGKLPEMSTQTTTTYDVFLSYPITESGAANTVSRALEQAGLDVFDVRNSGVADDPPFQETIWRALAESSAMIAIVPSEGPILSAVAVEVGAFKAWNKPIYVIQATSGKINVPTYLADCPVYSLLQVEDVVESIKRGMTSFSEEERAVLTRVYREVGIAADRLLSDPMANRVAWPKDSTPSARSGRPASGSCRNCCD